MVVAVGTEAPYVFLRRNLGDFVFWLDMKNERERTVRSNFHRFGLMSWRIVTC